MKINYTKARLITGKGIEVTPATEDDYRKMNLLLKTQQMEFYMFQLSSEKQLKVVLREPNLQKSTPKK